MKLSFSMALILAVGLAVGAAGAWLAFEGNGSDKTKGSEPTPIKMDINAQIAQATPARELIVMKADARVFSGAQKGELLSQKSTLYYLSRAQFTYSVDMRALNRNSFAYDANADVLKVKLPQLSIRSDVYGPRQRIASLAFLASEGGSGNELEAVADRALENDAAREAKSPALMKAALTSAKYEVGKLYEDALHAAGRKTRVVIIANNEPGFP